MNFRKIKKTVLTFSIFALTLFFSTSAFALKVPELTGPVIDKAGLLSGEQFSSLEKNLFAVSEQTGGQIVVVTIPSLEGVDIESYTMALAEKWKIGSKEKDDGVILCVAYNEKKIRIEVGYGLEGVLTDAKCGLIIRNVIAPRFQQGRFGDGIIEAVKTISGVIGVSGVTYDDSIFNEKEIDADETSFPIVLFFIIFYIIIISGALSTKFPGLRWLPWFFLFNGSGRRNHHHRNDDFFGGFGGGSSRGGGFGGFSGGGGGFGGGGASGSW